MKKIIAFTIFCLLLASCAPAPFPTAQVTDNTLATTAPPTAEAIQPASVITQPTATNTLAPTHAPTPTSAPTATSTPVPPTNATAESKATVVANSKGKVPNFDHIVLIVLENHGYSEVIGNSQAPNLNAMAKQYVLLTNDFAVRHPSLPNYIALMSGDTQKISSDCTDCFVNATNLADLVEASGRTWKAYEESMPSPCFVGNSNPYVQKHDPLIYFDSIRTSQARCNNIVPLTQLTSDLAANQLPNFSFIMPNLCNSGHDCSLSTADKWAGEMVTQLQASPALGKNSLIVITFDEGNEKDTTSCCGMGSKAGGQVATLLISPLAKPAFNDATPVSHYGLLKTILLAWGLPNLGKTSQTETQAIIDAWQ